MRFKPHTYQQYAIEYILSHEQAGLFLDMGLGKTVITLTALYELCLNRFEIHKVLIIAPKRVAESTWPVEIAKWEHLRGLRYSLVLGSAKERLAAVRADAELYIINRENVPWLIDSCHWDWDMVVIDELSSFKSTKAQRFRSLKKVRAKLSRIVGLTGTPAPNTLLDLWPQVYLLDGGERLGRFITKFRDTYFVPDRRNQYMVFSYKPKPGAEKQIYKRISDLCFSLKATDHLPMPELINTIVPVALDAKERAVYEELKREMVIELDGKEIDAVTAAVLNGKLSQMANGAVYDGDKRSSHVHDRKLDALEDLVESANGRPLLVAYWYKHDLERLQARFPAARVIDTAGDIQDWNNGEIPIGLLHPASGGHGLNLQAGGNTVVWFALTWSLELYQQLNARLYRQGQQASTVVVQHIVAQDTIDERMMAVLEGKEAGQTALIDAVRAELRR